MVWNFQDSYTKLPSIFYSKVNPENFNTYIKLGNVLKHQGEFDESVNIFKKIRYFLYIRSCFISKKNKENCNTKGKK